ncbi:MAG: hypothetical protein WC457_02620 [Patescibacteria group bacterium]
MDNPEEQFVAHPVGEEEAKTEKPKTKRTYKPRKPKAAPAEETIAKSKMVKIDKELKSIYEDRSGRIPNMTKITKKNRHPFLRFLISLLVIGGCMSAAAWLGFMYFPSANNVSSDSLNFQITGPTEVAIGATSTYILSWDNSQNTKLGNAIITVTYPDGFNYLASTAEPQNTGKTEWNIGTINAKAKGELKITGQNFGSLNQEKSWRVLVTYRPENMQSDLQKNISLKTKITESPIALAASGPDSIAVGDNARYVFTVKKLSEINSEKLILRPILPSNFSAVSTSPAMAKDGSWTVDFTVSTTSDELSYVLIGKFNDLGSSDIASSTAEIGASVNMAYGLDNRLFLIGETKIQTALAKNEQAFSLAINGTMSDFSARPDDSLNITVSVKNNGAESMKNVAIKLALDAPAIGKISALNWPDISDTLDGDIIGTQVSDKMRRGTITWNSTHLPALAEIKPGQEATIDLRLPIRSTADFDLASTGEYAIKAVPELNYKDSSGAQKTIGGNPISITLNSDLALEIRNSGNDKREISWILTNEFHPLKNLELSATLYGDINVEMGTAPAGEAKYDSGEKKITWTVPEMPESVNTLALPFTVTINDKNPTQNTLVSKVRVVAVDAVTGQTIEFMGDEVGM